jgi:hypothetical protein
MSVDVRSGAGDQYVTSLNGSKMNPSSGLHAGRVASFQHVNPL